ncbi:carcinoembryonic antigen-related cell adhesion molecule 3-like, partial [Sigmodon hispidus]
MLYNDGSLLLNDVDQKDGGLYTLRILRTDRGNEGAKVKLQVDTSRSVFCSPLTSSQLIAVAVPPYAVEREAVLLQVHNLPEDFAAFFWYKSRDRIQDQKIVEYGREMGSISWGPAHRETMTVHNNASLMLQDVTEKDAGMYTLEVLNGDFNIQKAYVEFYVKKNVTQPIVKITDNTVTGGTSVIFTCISSDTDITIRWIFNNKNLRLTERITLSPTKCGLRIDPVMSHDAGEYKCTASPKAIKGLGIRTKEVKLQMIYAQIMKPLRLI